jgi:uridine phosphorylase
LAGTFGDQLLAKLKEEVEFRMPLPLEIPLLAHTISEKSVFTPQALMTAVRAERGVPNESIPQICVLDFDGDLSDWLAATGRSTPCPAWSCFHTRMNIVQTDGLAAGIVARTIGGPYAVLVAEQMLASGAEVIVGLTSAGRVLGSLPVPSIVVPNRALRDEGTSFHYVAPGREVDAPAAIAEALAAELQACALPVERGTVWTTDAPYRETASQLQAHAAAGILAVEMQAASLYALAAAKNAQIGIVAYVTNAIDHEGEAFAKGGDEVSLEILRMILRAGGRVLHRTREA